MEKNKLRPPNLEELSYFSPQSLLSLLDKGLNQVFINTELRRRGLEVNQAGELIEIKPSDFSDEELAYQLGEHLNMVEKIQEGKIIGDMAINIINRVTSLATEIAERGLQNPYAEE